MISPIPRNCVELVRTSGSESSDAKYRLDRRSRLTSRLGRLSLLLLLILVLAACGSEPVQQDEDILVPVAPEAPITEEDATNPEVSLTAEASGNQRFEVPVGFVTQSRSAYQALELAVEQINSNDFMGGGRTIDLVSGEGSGDELNQIYVNLVSSAGVVALLVESDSGFEIYLARPSDVDTDEYTATADFTVTQIENAPWSVEGDAEVNQTFVEGFRSMSGADPDLQAASAYSSIYLLAEAIRRANSTMPGSLIDSLQQIDQFETPLGTFSGSQFE